MYQIHSQVQYYVIYIHTLQTYSEKNAKSTLLMIYVINKRNYPIRTDCN